jgi:lysophospholipase L1-like esterase
MVTVVKSTPATLVLLLGLVAGPVIVGCSNAGLDAPTVIQSSTTRTLPSATTDPSPMTPASPTPSESPTTTTTVALPTSTTTAPPPPPTTTTPGATGSTDAVTTTAPAEDVLSITVIGDSYSTGAPTDAGGVTNWTDFVVQGLDDNRIPTAFTLAAVGGTGYLSGRDTGETFADRVAASVTSETEMVIVFGSRNDAPVLLEPGGADQLRAAATTTYTSIRAIAPEATLIVVGAPWVNEAVPDTIVGIRDVLRNVADEFGAVFVDPIDEQWFFGDDARFISADGVHPTPLGHRYMAERILPVVLATVQGGVDRAVRPPARR